MVNIIFTCTNKDCTDYNKKNIQHNSKFHIDSVSGELVYKNTICPICGHNREVSEEGSIVSFTTNMTNISRK